MWKRFGEPHKKPHPSKEEQWKAIQMQMRGISQASNTTRQQQQQQHCKLLSEIVTNIDP